MSRRHKLRRLFDAAGLGQAARRTVRNGGYSVAGFGASFVVVIVCTPVVLHHLGTAWFGVWALTTSLLGLTNFVENGVGTAVVALVGRYASVRADDRLVGVFQAAALLAVATGAALGLTMYGLAPVLARVVGAQVGTLHPSMVQLLHLVALGCVPVLLRGVGAGVAMGLQRYEIAAVLGLIQAIGVWGGAAVAATAGSDIQTVLGTTVAATWISSIVAVGVGVAVSPARFLRFRATRDDFRALLHYTPFSTVSGIGSQIFGSLDKVTVGLLLGPVALAYYATVAGAAAKINQIVGLIWQGLVPVASGWKAAGAYERLARGLRLSTAACMVLDTLVCVVLLVTSWPALELWLGPDFATHALIPYRILVVVYALFSVGAPAYHIANGIGAPWINSATTVLGGALTIVLILVLGGRFGVNGAAAANGAYCIVLLAILLVNMQLIGHRRAAAADSEPTHRLSPQPFRGTPGPAAVSLDMLVENGVYGRFDRPDQSVGSDST